jgi:signal transduction histidine kinase
LPQQEKINKNSIFFKISLAFFLSSAIIIILLIIGVYYVHDQRNKVKFFSGFNRHLPTIIAEEIIATNIAEMDKNNFKTYKNFEFAIYKNNILEFSNIEKSNFPEILDDEINKKIFNSINTARNRWAKKKNDTEHKYKVNPRKKRLRKQFIHNKKVYSFGICEDITVLALDKKPPAIETIIFTFGGIVIILTTSILLIILYLFINRLLVPLNILIHATNQFSSGNLNYRIEKAGFNEFQLLAESFNNMGTQIENMMKNNLVILGNISHDLKYYLTRLKMEIEIEIENKNVKDSLQEDIDTMNSYIDRATESYKAGLKQLNIKKTDLLIQDFIEKKIKNHPLIKSDLNAETLVIQADPLYFGIAIENLFSNAEKYGSNTYINLCLTTSTINKKSIILYNSWKLEITNQTDSLIPEDELSLLFQPFYRCDKSRTQNVKGSGLGLFLTKKILEDHFMEITILSFIKKGNNYFKITICPKKD